MSLASESRNPRIRGLQLKGHDLILVSLTSGRAASLRIDPIFDRVNGLGSFRPGGG